VAVAVVLDSLGQVLGELRAGAFGPYLANQMDEAVAELAA